MFLILAIVFIVLTGVCILVGLGLCRWKNRIISHLNPGDDLFDDD